MFSFLDVACDVNRVNNCKPKKAFSFTSTHPSHSMPSINSSRRECHINSSPPYLPYSCTLHPQAWNHSKILNVQTTTSSTFPTTSQETSSPLTLPHCSSCLMADADQRIVSEYYIVEIVMTAMSAAAMAWRPAVPVP
jgi:hypothetical protein